VECCELFEAWGDRILRQYLWDIAGSFAHGNSYIQGKLYEEAWCKISWCQHHYETAALMNVGFEYMERYAYAQGWCRSNQCRSRTAPYRMVRRKMRFIIRRGEAMALNVV
jgi:hypothetical protein